MATKRRRGLRGLRGTEAQHEEVFDRYLGLGTRFLAEAENRASKHRCASANEALRYAHMAGAENKWLGQPKAQPITRLEKYAKQAIEDSCLCKIPAKRRSTRR